MYITPYSAVSNHRQVDILFMRSLWQTAKKAPKIPITDPFCVCVCGGGGGGGGGVISLKEKWPVMRSVFPYHDVIM